MRLSVIAEGVETEDQLALLQNEECHEYQGYLFARPMDAESIYHKFLPVYPTLPVAQTKRVAGN